MNRTVFTMSDDGNLLITREARMGTPGAAKDRRRRSRFLERDHSYNPWVRKDRVIVRPGKPVPEKAERWVPYWQDGLMETHERASINNLNAKMHAAFADQTVEEIEAAIAAFEVPPMPEVKVLLSYNGVVAFDYAEIEKRVLRDAVAELYTKLDAARALVEAI